MNFEIQRCTIPHFKTYFGHLKCKITNTSLFLNFDLIFSFNLHSAAVEMIHREPTPIAELEAFDGNYSPVRGIRLK